MAAAFSAPAGAEGGAARQDGGGTAAAAGEAAAAAVGAGQMAQDGFLTGILLHLEDLGGDGQDQAEHRAQDAQDGDGGDDVHSHFTAPLTKSSGRRSP